LARWIVFGLGGAITLMLVALAVGMRNDDRQIDTHLAAATGTVLSISPLRTGVEFVDGNGVSVRPPNGVMYPGLLSLGQKFKLEYSTLDPSISRVAGRSAVVANVGLGLTFGVTWIVDLAVIIALRRRSRIRLAVAQSSSELPTSTG